MNRREMMQRMAVVLGGSLLGADSLLAKNINWDNMEYGPEGAGGKGIGQFSKSQIKLMNEIAETIIPTTSTPGAKAAKVGQFMAVIVSDCYEPDAQQRFQDGLLKVDEVCKGKYAKTFMKCTPEQRHEVLVMLDGEQKEANKARKKGDPAHYFKVIKDLVLWGYFTSEIGSTQALRFLEYPGRYETIDYKKGDRAWGGY